MAATDNDSTDSHDEIAAKDRNLRKKQKVNPAGADTDAQHSPKVKDKSIPDPGSFIIPEIICQCMQKCTDRVTAPLIQRICMYFKGITDRNHQYKYLSKLIQIRQTNSAISDKKLLSKGKFKASFRYFVPIITEADFNQAVEKRTADDTKTETPQSNLKKNDKPGDEIKTNGAIENDIEIIDADEDNWDHIEVCLKAFINVHVISDKRVILTRATQKLQTSVKCSRPFSWSSYAGIPTVTNGTTKPTKFPPPTTQKRHREDTPHRSESKARIKIDSGAEMSRLAGEWLLKQAMQSKRESSINLNPRTLLPEGLVLPSSVTCMPIYSNRESEQLPTRPYLEEDHDRDLNIVSDFFSDQLWKLENIGGIP